MKFLLLAVIILQCNVKANGQGDPCDPDPCAAGATCIVNGQDFFCQCFICQCGEAFINDTCSANVSCSANELLVPHPFDCSKYYVCGNALIERQCAPTLIFNPQNSQCELSQNVACGQNATRTLTCNIGTYSNGGLCPLCPMGTFSNETGQENCTACPTGFSTKGTGSTSEDNCTVVVCPPGYENQNNTCVICDKGFYKNTSDPFKACVACPDSNYTTLGNGTTDISGCNVYICKPGEQPNATNDGCDPCPVGTYQTEEGEPYCTNCTTNYTTENTGSDNGTLCIRNCLAGSEPTAEGDSCQPCEIGYYQPDSGKIRCLACINNTSTRSQGADNSSLCEEQCRAGEASINSECVPCPLGTYQEMSLHFESNCTKCAENYTTVSNGTINGTECTFFCPPGYENMNNTCFKCKKGFYKSTSDPNDVCVACPDSNYTTLGTGTTDKSGCNVYICKPGEQPNATNDGCDPCPVGTYQTEEGEPYCTNCTTNYTTENTGSNNGTLCIRNCLAGSEPTAKGDSCQPCELGFYQPDSGKLSCLACPSNTSTRSQGSDNSSLCEEYCGDGQQKDPDSESCESCPVGYYRNITSGLFTDCTMCPTEFITTSNGSINEAQCTVANCSRGSYRNSTTNVCVPCEVGTYQSQKWQDNSCMICQENYTTVGTGAMDVNECLLICEPGKYNNQSDQCLPCPIGTFKNFTGVALSCKLCDSNYITNSTGAISDDECNIANCTNGRYTTKNNTCEKCPIATYQDQWWQDDCLDCGNNSIGILLTTSEAGAGSYDDCFDPITEKNLMVTSVEPDFGPIAGGTKMVISGSGIVAQSVAVYLGEDLECVDVSSNFSGSTQMIFATTPVVSEDLAGKDFELILELDGRNNVSTAVKFTYKSNPVVTSLFPLDVIKEGGTTLYVTGDNLDSVAMPFLRVTAEVREKATGMVLHATVYESPCNVTNTTTMECLTPYLRYVSDDFIDDSSSRRRREAFDPLEFLMPRARRATLQELFLFLGIFFDGLPDFQNVTANDEISDFGQLKLQRTPQLTGLPTQKFVFEPDKPIDIQGKDLGHVPMNDYMVTVGLDGLCKIIQITDSTLTCLPPQKAPERRNKNETDDNIRDVLMLIGVNVKNAVGELSYGSPLPLDWIVVGVVLGIVFLVIVTAVIILAVRWKRRRKSQEKSEMPYPPDMFITMPPVSEYDRSLSVGRRSLGRDSLTGRRHSGISNLLQQPNGNAPPKKGQFKKRKGLDENFIMYNNNNNERGQRRLRRHRVSEFSDSQEKLNQMYSNFKMKHSGQDSYLGTNQLDGPGDEPVVHPGATLIEIKADSEDERPQPQDDNSIQESQVVFDDFWRNADEGDHEAYNRRIGDKLEETAQQPPLPKFTAGSDES